MVRQEKRRSVPIHSANYKGLGGIACGPDVRFGSLADMCNANGMSALHLIATVKADIALQDACASRRH